MAEGRCCVVENTGPGMLDAITEGEGAIDVTVPDIPVLQVINIVIQSWLKRGTNHDNRKARGLCEDQLKTCCSRCR